LVSRKQPRQGVLAVEEWAIPEILTITLHQVEGVEDGSARGLQPAQVVES
jgi:hypothetical protein